MSSCCGPTSHNIDISNMHMQYPNIVGASVPKFGPVIDGNDRSLERNVLRTVWNNNYHCNKDPNKKQRAIGGFRMVMNAGDYLSRVNAPCGGSNQVTSRPGMMVMTTKDGVQQCGHEHPPVANTNVKYVYDSSDFTRYRKESSINAGYAGNIPADCDNNEDPKDNLTDYTYGGSGVPIGRGRQMRIGSLNSYGRGNRINRSYM